MDTIHRYYRYLDDIFIIWPHGEKPFISFLKSLKEHEPPIRFKAPINKDKMDCLDTTIFINPNNKYELLTKVQNNFHLKHAFRSIVSHRLLVACEYDQNNQIVMKHAIPWFKHYAKEDIPK